MDGWAGNARFLAENGALGKTQTELLASAVEALTRRMERLEGELMLLRTERTAQRLDSGAEEPIPSAVARRVFVEDAVPIRAFREWRGLTQEELARRIGSSKSYLSQLETRRRTPGVKTLRRIAGALDVPVEILME